MDNSTRLKVLARLAELRTESALASIRHEFDSAVKVLSDSTGYVELEFSLEVLSVIGVVHSEEATNALARFIREIDERRLAPDGELEGSRALSRYRTPRLLLRKAIEVITLWRYLHTEAVLSTLLWSSIHADESVRKVATSSLKKLAALNIDVYFGRQVADGRAGGIGAQPQLRTLAALEALDKEERRRYFRPILTVVTELFSTRMESASWSSTAMTLNHATAPAAPRLIDLRDRCLKLLAVLYKEADSTAGEIAVVNCINSATRAENRVAVDPAYGEMVDASSIAALAMYKDFVKSADFQVIEKIEHHSYWIHYHSPSEKVRNAALEVKEAIDEISEYTVYKTLIGFEGVFGEWTGIRDLAFRASKSQEARAERAQAFVAEISAENYPLWKQRILDFSRTNSNDMATFPVLYEFLSKLAEAHPSLAMGLLQDEAAKVSPFQIALLRGLLQSHLKEDVKRLMWSWVTDVDSAEDARLFAAAKVFLSAPELDLEFLRAILAKAKALGGKQVIHQVITVALTRFAATDDKDSLKDLFFDSLSYLTKLKDANWVDSVWFRDEAKDFVATLSGDERKVLFENLIFLSQIDYQAEGVLAVVAEHDPLEVVDFLFERGSREDQGLSLDEMTLDDYEAVPFALHALQEPLSKDPEAVVQRVLQHYRQTPELFEFRGGKLLQAVFPEFPELFANSLVRVIQDRQEEGLDFVAQVLRAFDGRSAIAPVAKELVKALDADSPLRADVEIALQTTGVVMGEFGMAEAYERKREEVLDWLQDENERVRDFARTYVSDLENMAKTERSRAQESIALRKHRYGEE